MVRKLIGNFFNFFVPPPRHVHRKISTGVDGGWAEDRACVDPGARTPIGASGNFIQYTQGTNYAGRSCCLEFMFHSISMNPFLTKLCTYRSILRKLVTYLLRENIFTSCGSVVSVLVCQSGDPGSICGVSRIESTITKGKGLQICYWTFVFVWQACAFTNTFNIFEEDSIIYI